MIPSAAPSTSNYVRDTIAVTSLLCSEPPVPWLQETRYITVNHGNVAVLDGVPAQPITGGCEYFWHQNSSRSY